MQSAVQPVTVHASQYPAAVTADLWAGLRGRAIPGKFHYGTPRQAQKWLELHHRYAPSNRDAGCGAAFDAGFAAAIPGVGRGRQIEVVGLCCGDGAKEARLLAGLLAAGKQPVYRPGDGSLPLVLAAALAAPAGIAREHIHPWVADLATADDLAPAILPAGGTAKRGRLVTCFGTLHNLPVAGIGRRLAAWLRRGDQLLLSTNLLPAPGDAATRERIRRQYDNPLTHEWLGLFLADLGIPTSAGAFHTSLEACPEGTGLTRVVITFRFARDCGLRLPGATFRFRAGTRLQLFYSYRYTAEALAGLLAPHGLKVTGQWQSPSGEEGVFLVRRE